MKEAFVEFIHEDIVRWALIFMFTWDLYDDTECRRSDDFLRITSGALVL